MKSDKIVQFLQIVGVKNANPHKRTGYVISRCPLQPWNHENGESGPEVFGVKIESGNPKCSCFACGYYGTLGGLVQTMVGMNKITPRIEAKWGDALQLTDEAELESDLDLDSPGIEEVMAANKKTMHVFPDWWLDGFPPAHNAPAACSYLQKRNVWDAIALEMDIRWDPLEQRICFPVRDFKQRLVGMHGRALDPDQEPRYRMYTQAKKNNPIVWLGESWVDTNKPIVVVEGPFDLTSVARVYRNVASPLFATPSYDKIRRMSDCLEWITLFDRGAGGDAGRERVTKALGSEHVIHHLHPPKGRKDPGEMTQDELVALLGPILAPGSVFALKSAN